MRTPRLIAVQIWKIYSILLTIILAGLMCIVIAESVKATRAASQVAIQHWWDSWPVWLETFGTTLLIAGALGLVEKAVLADDHFRRIREIFRLHESTSTLGLLEVSLNAGNYDYGELIEKSRTLTIVMNDGRTWVSGRIDQFQRRFSQDGLLTEVCLIDPDGQFCEIIAKKTDYTVEAQKNKINEAVRRFVEEFEKAGKKGRLKIHYLHYFPTHTVVIGDDTAVFTLYGISKGRRKVPTFLVSRTGLESDIFSTIKADVEALSREARIQYDSENQAAGQPATGAGTTGGS